MFEILERLRVFLEQPSGQTVFTAVMAIVAVVVSVITPIVAALSALWVARMQIRSTLVSANRQKWVDEMRSILSELLALNYVITHAPQKHDDVDASIKVFTLRNRLRLLTDAGNSEHRAINTAIDRLIEAPSRQSYDGSLERQVVEASHRLFDAELTAMRKGR